MKDPPLTLVPSVRLVTATAPDLAQLAAWEKLWQQLLTNITTNGNASSGELEASTQGTADTGP